MIDRREWREWLALCVGLAALVVPIVAAIVSLVQVRLRLLDAADLTTRSALAATAIALIAVVCLGLIGGRYAKTSAMVVLSLIAPWAVALFLRLAFRACTGFNVWALPWPEPVRAIAQVFCALVVLASTAGIAYGYTRRELRPTSIALTVASAIFVIPTMFLFVLTIFGDPGPDCVPF